MASSSGNAPSFLTNSSTSHISSALSSNSPCAACKFLRRKCQPDCVFAPYFPPDNPQKFVNVHRVFGASNVTKILNDLPPYHREDAVNSLAYEAHTRLQYPVHGCVKVITELRAQLDQLRADLARAKFELAQYQSAAAAGAGGGANGAVGFTAHGLININHPIEVGGIGFGREQFFNVAPREHHHMMMKTYDADLLARLGANGGYDSGIVAAMNRSIGPFMRSNPAGGEEKSGIGPL